jgi:hypothetical protein
MPMIEGNILQKCTKAHGVMGEPMPKSAFLAIHESTMKKCRLPLWDY